MRYIPKLFIETTVFNFYVEGKQGKKQKDAVRLFEKIATGNYEAYTSEYVIAEINDAPERKSRKMKELSHKHIKSVIAPTPEAQNLADLYIARGIIPPKYGMDAIHIATAAINNLDFVVSFNQGHIVKTKTMIGVGFANLRNNCRQIGLSTPTEILDYDI